LLIVLNSCATSINNSNGFSDKLSQIYIVDTIYFSNPIVVEHENMFYVTEKDSISLYSDFKVNNDNVFLLGMDLYYDLPLSMYNLFSYPDYGCCNLRRSKTPHLLFFEKNPNLFILALINSRYFEKKHQSLDSPIKIDFGHQNNSYIKIVYPLCDN
jgi:hypothetical protein